MRGEIAALIEQRKAIFPVLVEGARLPEESELPAELRTLLRFQATAIDNGGWEATMSLLIRAIESVIRHAENAGGAQSGDALPRET